MTPDDPVGPPEERPLGAMRFEPGYRLSLVLEADGTIRDVIEADGVIGWKPGMYEGRSVGDVAAGGVRGSARALAWLDRLDVARQRRAPARYADLRPDAHDDGEPVVDTMVTPVMAADGTVEAILVHATDMSEAREARRALHESELRFRVLAESLPQMVWISDAHGRPEYYSPRWTEFTGRDHDTLIARGIGDLVHPDDRSTLQADSKTPAGRGRLSTFRLRRHDGEYRWMEAEAQALLGDDGDVIRWVGGTTDNTDRRREAEARLTSKKREALGTLASGMAHDFNNVIGAVMANAAVAESEIAAGDSPATSVHEILLGARRASDLVKRMLTFSREEEPGRDAFDLIGVVHEATRLIRPTLPAAVDLREMSADPSATVLGDAGQLHQVVMNLISNAGHAIGAQPGVIELSLDSFEDPDITSEPAVSKRFIRLRVRDTGHGMSEAVAARAFDPFFTTKRAGEGTGLGLASTATIVRNHGGTVSIDSVVDEGTTVTIVLPAGAPAAEDRVGTTAAAERSDRPDTDAADSSLETGPRVLFVDDEEALGRAASRIFPAFGMRVEPFGDPVAALEAFSAAPHAFDAIVTDLSMPQISGLDLVRRARAAHPSVPIVLSSGYLSDEDHANIQALAIDALVLKPCSLEQVARTVKELLET